MKAVFYILCIFSLVSCGDGIKDFFNQNSTGELRWEYNRLPVTLNISAELNNYGNDIQKAVDVWNDALGFEAIVLRYGQINNKMFSSIDEILEQETNSMHFQYNWNVQDGEELLPSQNLAVTVSKVSQNKIMNSTIIFNNQYHVFNDLDFVAGQELFFSYDFQSVLIHELGHFLGLPHSNNIEDVMFPTINKTEKKRILSTFDLEAIRSLYPN